MVGLVRVAAGRLLLAAQRRRRRRLRPAQADAGHADGDGDLRRGARGADLARLDAVWPVYAIAAASSAAGAFDLPARQALTPNLVPREHLPTRSRSTRSCSRSPPSPAPRSAASSSASSASRWAYAFNAVSFLVVIAALLMMTRRRTRSGRVDGGRRTAAKKTEFTLHAALEGLRFVFRAPLIRSTMLLDFFATFFSSATALLPLYAQDILGVGAQRLRLALRGAGGGRDRDERDHGARGGLDRSARRRADLGGAGYGLATVGVRPVARASGCRSPAWR